MKAYLHLFLANSGCLTKANNKRWCNGATPQTSLLTTTRNDGVESDPWSSSHVAGTDTLGTVDLVTGDGHEVDVHLVDVEGDLADCLCAVGVEEDLLRSAELSDLLDGLHDTNLVVDSHDGDKHGFRPHGSLQLLHVDSAVGLDGKVCDLVTLVLQVTATVEDALVLGLACDDVVLLATALEES